MTRRLPHLQIAICTLAAIPLPLLGAASGPGGKQPTHPGSEPKKPVPSPELVETQVLKDESLMDVTSVVTAPGGKHAYAAAFNPSILSIHDRDTATGKLTLRKTLTDPDHNGVVAFRLSDDGKLGAATCFRANSLILYARDTETGDLKKLDVAGGPDDAREALNFCCDSVFSPDGKHIYSIASRAIGVFGIVNNQLVAIETITEVPIDPEPVEALADQAPPERNLMGGRGIAISPDGLTLFSAWNTSGVLSVHRRDPATGKLTHFQTLRDDGREMVGLDGIMRVTVSRDGHHVYTSSGRFGGVDAVCCFDLRNGALKLSQGLLGKDLPPNFRGGNEIIVSPDQRQVAVACTKADTVALFHRDPQSGHLSPIETIESGPAVNPGPAGLCWSPDGKFLHVADEESSCLVTFRLRRR